MTALLLLFAVLYAVYTWYAAKREKQAELIYISEFSAKAAEQFFDHYSIGLQLLGSQIRDADGLRDLARVRALLIRFRDANPDVANLHLFRLDGQILVTTQVELGKTLPNRRRYPGFWPSFQATMASRTLNIGRPLYGNLVNGWVIPLRYPVRDEQGHLLFVLAANLLLQHQQSIWRNLSLPEGTAIGLIRDDYYLESRWPNPDRLDVAYGRPKSGPLAQALRQGTSHRSGAFEGRPQLWGIAYRIGAFHRLANYPLTAFVSLPLERVWEDWWQRIQIPLLLLALLYAGGFGVFRRALYLQGQLEEDRRLAEEALFQAKESAEVTLHSIGDAVIATDAQGRISYMNPVAERLTGYALEEARERPLGNVFIIVDESSREAMEDPVSKVLRENRIIELANHTVLIARDGKEIAIEDSAAPIHDRQGRLLGVVLVFHDVTKARALANEISWQARHDPMTGLVNRRAFEEYLIRGLDTARQSGRAHAVLFLDLDRFKVVNDTCGHLAGDELLRQIANVLQSRIRTSDLLARMGGDEFALFLEGCSLDKAREIADSLVEAVSEFRFIWDGRIFPIGVSIGVTVLHGACPDINVVLQAADTACYLAKDQGRNRICVYEAGNREILQHHEEMAWVSQLSSALEEGRLQLYRQRIVPLNDKGAPAYDEILLRMLTHEGEVLSPGTFISALERYGLMPSIDRWVVRTLLRHLREKCLAPDRSCPCDHVAECPCRYAINISGATLNDEYFLEFVLDQLRQSGIAPHNLSFEITETAAIANLARAQQFISVLRAKGCHFALDDFGSGLSSFAYLKHLPVDYLKIDGVFVRDIATDRFDFAMVEAVNRVAHELGLQTVAEFVEDGKTLDILKQLGVDYAQGYAIHRPEPLMIATLLPQSIAR